MRANQSTDAIDLNLAFELRNLFLYQCIMSHSASSRHAECDMMHLPE